MRKELRRLQKLILKKSNPSSRLVIFYAITRPFLWAISSKCWIFLRRASIGIDINMVWAGNCFSKATLISSSCSQRTGVYLINSLVKPAFCLIEFVLILATIKPFIQSFRAAQTCNRKSFCHALVLTTTAMINLNHPTW